MKPIIWKLLASIAVALALGLLWRMSENGRFAAVPLNTQLILLVDTRDGATSVRAMIDGGTTSHRKAKFVLVAPWTE